MRITVKFRMELVNFSTWAYLKKSWCAYCRTRWLTCVECHTWTLYKYEQMIWKYSWTSSYFFHPQINLTNAEDFTCKQTELHCLWIMFQWTEIQVCKAELVDRNISQAQLIVFQSNLAVCASSVDWRATILANSFLLSKRHQHQPVPF